MHAYGLPYKGSKSAIAPWVVEHLPQADTLVDLFCGGCAVTHAALLSGKWRRIIANDIQGDVPQLFLDAVQGKYTAETCTQWVSREDFYRLKDIDPYIRLCWSFGNDGQSYLYGREIEPLKREIHIMITGKTAHERRLAWAHLAAMLAEPNNAAMLEKVHGLENLQRLQSLERLQNLERLQSLEGTVAECVTPSGRDYRDVRIPEDAVIYCDIPYDCTKHDYGVKFDYAAFFDWAAEQTAPVIFSEYDCADARFALLAQTQKTQLSGGAKARKSVNEKLFAPKRQLEMIRARLTDQVQMAF